MNVISFFLESSLFVKGIVLLLLFASIWSWALFFYKITVFWKAKKLDKPFLSMYQGRDTSASDLFDRYKHKQELGPFTYMFISGIREWERYKKFQKEHHTSENINIKDSDQVNAVMEASFDRAIFKLRFMLASWATIGGAAPFIGLLGTVWGIMASFSSLSQVDQITLQSLAPGIAEALFATAAGLFTAIPAVIFYNFFVMRIRHWEEEGMLFIKDFNRLVFYYNWQNHDKPKETK